LSTAPLVKAPPPLSAFVGLALLAGAPAILGMWLGSLASSPQWSALALAIGAGAILQVIVEVGAYLRRSDGGWKAASVPVSVIAGLAAGLSVMYATAVLVKI
jgi:ZIP family zinc transporter